LFYSFVAAILLATISMHASAARNNESVASGADKYCIELTEFGLPAGYLNLRMIVSIEDASANEKQRLVFYKAVKSPVSDEILYVFSYGSWSDLYMVVVADPKQKSIRRRFLYGSLHYPCSKKS